jgi:tetratricopeptide (TPR) repeat protein
MADKLTRHAATCNHCGPLLRTYTEDFSDDFSPEQQAVLTNLQSSSASWQKKTARQMLSAAGASAVGASAATASNSSANASTAAAISTDAATNSDTTFSLPGAASLPNRKSSAHPGQKIFFWKWAFPAATAACALIAFSLWFTQRDTPVKVEKLLAQAYTENRNLEMRIPYAKHSDFHQERGESGSLINSPDSLRLATSEIEEHLRKSPDAPKWLLLQARLDLLDWRYKPAIAALSKIDDEKIIDSTEAIMMRGLAAFEQAETEHEEQGYFQAIDLFGKILQKNPNEAITLFNRAIVCEKQHAYECASSDWKHLLEVEKDPDWSAEARKHLNRIEEKKNLAH